MAVARALDLAKLTGAGVHGVHATRPVVMTGTLALDATAVEASNTTRHDEAERVGKQFVAEAERSGVRPEVAKFRDPPTPSSAAAEAAGRRSDRGRQPGHDRASDDSCWAASRTRSPTTAPAAC